MKKTHKNNVPGNEKSGHPSFKEIAYRHWRKGTLPAADEVIRREAAREFIEADEETEFQGEERRWEENPGDDEPGEAP